ncbi:benenodin family lasso peptide [Sphingomonas panacis]|nr:benenodin family lasso peptide [Sphingomonas panacis]
MNRSDEHRDDELIDLGSVIEQTKGMGAPFSDTGDGRQLQPGLTDD